MRHGICCRHKRGPDTIYNGYLDQAGCMGSLWMGVKELTGLQAEAPKTVPEVEKMLYSQTDWHFLQVLHVFNTQQVSIPRALQASILK